MLRSNEKRNLLLKTLLVAVSVGLTALGKYGADKLLGVGPPLVFFFPAVMLCAFLGGLWAGLAATVFSTLCVMYFFMGDAYDFRVGSYSDVFRLFLFICISSVISYLFESVQRQKAKLQKLNKAKDRFIATLGHELRVPLNRISLITENALMDESVSQSAKAAFEEILRSNEIEQVLIRDVLDIAKVEADKLICNFDYIDLVSVVTKSFKLVEIDFQSKHIQVESFFSHPQIFVYADRIRVKQVMWNLIRNAVKFSPEGSTIIIRVSFKQETSSVVIEVCDRGIGLKPDELESIFEPYKQINNDKKSVHGLGLGLAICKAIVAEHHGKIWAESEGEGQGCTFKVMFDAALKKPETSHNQAPRVIGRAGATSDHRKKRVLLVDDDELILHLLGAQLGKMGFETMRAASCEEAKRIDPSMVDTVISDFNLADGNGWDVLNHFKDCDSNITVIALSGEESPWPTKQVSHHAFDHFLTKPVSYQRLSDLLHQSSG